MAMRLARPSVLIDVNRVEDLTFEADTRGLPGAGRADTPAGGGAFGRGPAHRSRCCERRSATSDIRRSANRGTIGGSLAHADPAAELPTVAVALDATMVIQRAGGERTVRRPRLFHRISSPRPSNQRSCSRLCGSPPSPQPPAAAIKNSAVATGTSPSSASPWSSCSEVTPPSARRAIALSGVGSVPVRAAGAEAVVTGQRPASELWEAAGSEAARDIEPTSDLHGSAEYRRRLAAHLVADALETAAGAASGGHRE